MLTPHAEAVVKADLDAYWRAKHKFDAAEAKLFSTIKEAHAAGSSLRDLAALAGWSHEWIHRIVRDRVRKQR